MSLFLPIICGSVRENRQSIKVAEYLCGKVEAAGHESLVVDFTKLPLPFVNTPVPPGDLKGLGQDYPDENVRQWSKIAARADGFVIAAPEYNHGYSGVLKNALDWLSSEFNNKPLALVGVSSGAVGGARVIEQLRALAGNFALYDIRENLMVRSVQDVIDDAAGFEAQYGKQADKLLQALTRTAEVMKQLRSK